MAHETRPVFLELVEIAPNVFDATWRVPAQFGIPLPVRPEFFQSCHVKGSTIVALEDNLSAVARFMLSCAHGLGGAEISLIGLKSTQVDGLVRIRLLTGQIMGGLVHPTQGTYTVPKSSGSFDVFFTYATLGLEHIASGFDHLLFVTALVLLIGNWRRILIAVTAFTIAHSISLALAALHMISVPIQATEALIALSILLLVVELRRSGEWRSPDTISRNPWVLAFTFGLLHGLGFASGLSEIGLPNHEIPLALLSFNIGVELGQFAFVAVLLAMGLAIGRLNKNISSIGYTSLIYGIGGLASFWFFQRVAGL